MKTFKELLDQCSWEDLEDFLYEFSDAGRGKAHHIMEGFHRMYDELCQITPRHTNRKIGIQRIEEKYPGYPEHYLHACFRPSDGCFDPDKWSEYLGREIIPPKGRGLPPAALVAACMSHMHTFGYTRPEYEEAVKDLDIDQFQTIGIDMYDNPSLQTKKWLAQEIQSYHPDFEIPAWNDLTTMSQKYKISIGGSGWGDLLDDFPRQLEIIPQQLCKYRKYWIITTYPHFAVWEIIQRPLQTWIKKQLPPQAEIFRLTYEAQVEWDWYHPFRFIYVTIIAGK